ncbi:unnamed protein product [Ranitomeya imitator]|uniref:Uncharacterized protein n=1 Tax=Ranitomeya imitator TaxID=111125 RepID=A0ABN9KVK5_9NEOB|nr:unnamed protein product [Ranitomeya imitator]
MILFALAAAAWHWLLQGNSQTFFIACLPDCKFFKEAVHDQYALVFKARDHYALDLKAQDQYALVLNADDQHTLVLRAHDHYLLDLKVHDYVSLLVAAAYTHGLCPPMNGSEKRILRDSSSDPSPPIVDLIVAEQMFTKLCQNKWIADIICSSLRNELIPATESLPNLFEALSIFLIIPACPIMHDPDICLPLVAPFAQAINNLSSNALKMLGMFLLLHFSGHVSIIIVCYS